MCKVEILWGDKSRWSTKDQQRIRRKADFLVFLMLTGLAPLEAFF